MNQLIILITMLFITSIASAKSEVELRKEMYSKIDKMRIFSDEIEKITPLLSKENDENKLIALACSRIEASTAFVQTLNEFVEIKEVQEQIRENNIEIKNQVEKVLSKGKEITRRKEEDKENLEILERIIFKKSNPRTANEICETREKTVI